MTLGTYSVGLVRMTSEYDQWNVILFKHCWNTTKVLRYGKISKYAVVRATRNWQMTQVYNSSHKEAVFFETRWIAGRQKSLTYANSSVYFIRVVPIYEFSCSFEVSPMGMGAVGTFSTRGSTNRRIKSRVYTKSDSKHWRNGSVFCNTLTGFDLDFHLDSFTHFPLPELWNLTLKQANCEMYNANSPEGFINEP